MESEGKTEKRQKDEYTRSRCEQLIRPSILSSTVGSSASVFKMVDLISAFTSWTYDGDARAMWIEAVTTVSFFFL